MWKTATAASALTLALTTMAPAQGTSARTAPPASARTPAPAPTPSGSTRDAKVYKAEVELPGPLPLDKIAAPTIALPTDAIEPYLLTKGPGPFMILAHTFRGPDATKFALALTKELREKEHLPAYIFNLKITPGRSNIRDVAPTAERHIEGGEKALGNVRIYDEAAVLVGDCKSLAEGEKLLHRVKKIHPVCLDGLPTIWHLRKGQGLSRALLTQNPYAAGQDLYPGKAFDPSILAARFEANKKIDPMIAKINQGPHSIFKCPGQYTLPVAEFTGKSIAIASDPRFLASDKGFGKGTLATAAEDAEKFAERLTKDPALSKTSYQPYVYHDRHGSKVMLGSFHSPDDPSAQSLRKMLTEVEITVPTGKTTRFPDGKGGTKEVPEVSFLTPAQSLMQVPKP